MSDDIPHANDVDYTDIPYHLQVIDHVEGEAWEEVDNDSTRSAFHHLRGPGVKIYIRLKDEHPVWRVTGGGFDSTGSSLDRLKNITDAVNANSYALRILYGRRFKLLPWMRLLL